MHQKVWVVVVVVPEEEEEEHAILSSWISLFMTCMDQTSQSWNKAMMQNTSTSPKTNIALGIVKVTKF